MAKPDLSIYPAFVDGIAYSSWSESGSRPFFQLLASGGNKPYKWKVISGALPLGINLSSDGKLRGQALREADYEFIVEVSDSKGKNAIKGLTFRTESFRSKWMADAKFGIMLQWGAFTEPALYAKDQIPLFEQRIKNFDADKWAETIAKLGGRVLNFSVKGGDGIRLWPSTTPSCQELKTKRNLTLELINACHKRGIKFVAYFAPDNSWNKVVMDTDIDCKSTSSGAELNKGLIRELIKMGVDGLWIDMAASSELYPGSYGKWFPWNEMIPIIRANNPYAIFANNPGVHYGGTALRWPNTDVLVYEGRVSASESALQVAKPQIISKKVAIEVDNMLDNYWWEPVSGSVKNPKPASMIIKNMKANWEIGATYMLNYPIPANGEILPELYKPILNEIGKFVNANNGWSEMPVASVINGEYVGFQTIKLFAKPDAVIYFSIDGSKPDKKSKKYVSPITIKESTRLRAIAYEEGRPGSKILDRQYGIRNPEKQLFANRNFTSKISKTTTARIEPKGYYRGIRITVGRRNVTVSQIGRKFVAGNKNIHKILVQRFFDQYTLLNLDIKSGMAKVEKDGYQYINIPPLTLEAGKSYLIVSEEDGNDKFVASKVEKEDVNADFRIAGNAILSSTGDRVPVVEDGYGEILSLKYFTGGKESENIALGSKATLLDNAGNLLIPSTEILYADNAVDGDNKTHAQAGGQYAWTLQIDLGKVVDGIIKAAIDFSREYYPTDFEVFYSTKGTDWVSLGRTDKSDNLQILLNLTKIDARYFRIRSYKPDGPGQKGGQMGVEEFRLFK
ncbi:alpha-L-fucosidase [Dyadobacter psychrotolerans]|nr:alpha-L-fucosidase [Dyadobacter psychrotolerans]